MTMSIMDAEVPSQRWALPSDSKWDRYYDQFEGWVNDHYDMETQSIFGRSMTWEQACEDENLFDYFVEDWEDALAEARAEARYDDGDW